MTSFVKSTKGVDKLIHEGFIYVKNKDGKDGKRYWRCENSKTGKCRGCAITDAINSVTTTQLHNHGPSPNRVELVKIKDNINQAAITSTLTPRAVVNSQLAGITDQAKANLPKLKNLEKAVGRKRFADGQQVPVPHLISETACCVFFFYCVFPLYSLLILFLLLRIFNISDSIFF